MSMAELLLTDYVSKRRTELESYASRDNANEAYIDRQNNNLRELSEILDLIENNEGMEIYRYIDDVWRNSDKKNPELAGITIVIRTKKIGMTSYLPINLYEII